ncbi:hypothetical protein [Lutispora saccharofermentans]|uniref:Uncharacterized protein n=1 Tax=Lutispora saccharofermentans TaxID=3024236 RepID=A0ABT1NG84_9FIRM|nr:hypothetical protein [Lutispora saccharofermentans]MCQ1530079.1 hypothetical protein [Lutispora saccharofermentans]
MLDNTITLFSSDSRPQYTKDIFNVLALPHGSMYRFRYKEKYIHCDIIGDLDNSKIKGTTALIAFRTNLGVAENKHFFIPVRWALIENVQKSADFYLIDFVVKGFAVFNKEFDDNRNNFDDINSLAKKYFTTNDKIEAFVVKNTPNIVITYNKSNKTNDNEEKDRWLKVIETLHIYPRFEKCYFFKASIIRNGLAKIFKPGIIREGGRTNINIEYNNFCDISDSEINIEYDECLLIPSGDKKTKIECRYDSAMFAFQAKGVLSKTPTQIILNCRSSQDIETKIKIPLEIKRNYFFLVARVILSLAGAILIGLPGILPDTTPTETTVPMFIAGSLLIAFNWLIPYKE